jgi:hypothetical protein
MPTFDDPLHDEFGSWILGFAPYGGGDVGEVEHLATQVKAGDDDSFFDAFVALGKTLLAEGDAAAASGRARTARDCYLRAAAYIGVGYHPLFGTPVDPRLVDAFHLQVDTFAKAMALQDAPGERLAIPYEGTHIPAWFLRNPRRPNDVLPTILVGGGWDSTMVENHLGMGVAALERDYHVLLHDGPGQGQLLIDEGLPLRHDWEHVVTPVVDAALAIDVVDGGRLVYQPWSLGGYMAPRVAAFEHRFAAVVADPGQLSVGQKVIDGFRLMGLTPEQEANLPALDPEFASGALQVIQSSRALNWSICKRAFWANGAPDLPSVVAELMRWTLTPEILANVTTPILVASAEGDRASTDTDQLYAALPGPKERISFTAAEGAGMHCEMLNRSLANRRILDWLDVQLA